MKRNPEALLQFHRIPYFKRNTEWLVVECPTHKDDHHISPDGNVSGCSGGLNIQTGQFTCFVCKPAKVDVIGFISLKLGVPETLIAASFDNIAGDQDPGNVKLETIELCHQELLGNQELRDRMFKQHAISSASIEKFRLGWHPSENRIIIPIKDAIGNFCNLRKYKYDSQRDKVIGIKGGKNILFPIESLESETIYITEGEFKAILLCQNGLAGITGTAGAGSWDRTNWSELFKGKNVVILFDVDEAGRRSADKLCTFLYSFAKTIKNVYLKEVQGIPKGDLTDWFTKKNKTLEELVALINDTPFYQPPKSLASQSKLEMNDPIPVSLSKSSHAEYNNKIVSTTAVVSAKDVTPYIIPKKCTVICNRDRPYCPSCVAYDRDKPLTFEIPSHSPAILNLIRHTDVQQDEVLKQHSGIFPKCTVAAFRRDESFNVEEVRLIPQIAIGHTTDEQVTRRAYNVGHGISTNHTYEFKGRVCAEPSDGHATLIMHEHESIQNDLDNFEPTLDLKIFQPTEWTLDAVRAKLNHIYDDLENNVTKIYKRRDLHIFYDIAWHTVLYINFQGRAVKAWGDVLVIGDSGQGKSECSTRMSTHYQCGERVDTKRASVAGIVGGLQQTDKRWFITWGTIPLNDRRLVILEEIKGMDVESLAKMTDMRSRGTAEIIKIERAITNARTRLIWISNPRSDNNLSSYNYGVDAVKELIGGLEDIRRFDMVMAVATGEVDQSVINSKHESVVEHTYTSALCQELISWAWSRKEVQIILECEDELLASATRMGQSYSAACPIVEPSDQRLKLLRLAAGLAARTYSCDANGNLVIRNCHVQFVEEFLNRIYSSKALGYKDFSAKQLGELRLDNPEAVKKILLDQPHCSSLIDGLIEAEQIRAEDIINLTEHDMSGANGVISQLVRNGCISRNRRGGYKKTSAFIDILKEMSRQNNGNQTWREKLQKEAF